MGTEITNHLDVQGVLSGVSLSSCLRSTPLTNEKTPGFEPGVFRICQRKPMNSVITTITTVTPEICALRAQTKGGRLHV